MSATSTREKGSFVRYGKFGGPLLTYGNQSHSLRIRRCLIQHSRTARWNYFRSRTCPAQLTDQVIDIVAANAARIASPHSTFPIFQLGGAISRIADDDTAYAGCTAESTVNITGITEDAIGFDEERQWVRRLLGRAGAVPGWRVRQLPHG